MKKALIEPITPKVVVGVAAHPDDLDFSAGGTMAKYASLGAKIHYVIVTDGSKGSEDRSLSSQELVQIRQQEQKAAVSIIGGKDVTFMDYIDGEIEVSMKLKLDIAREIRRLKPDVVVTMDPLMLYDVNRGFINHPDHRAVGQATLDAVFPLARDHMSFPSLLEEGHEPHKTATILLANLSGEQCNYYEDIVETFEKKLAALAAHKSQISDLPAVDKKMRLLAEKHGQSIGYKLGESFKRIDIE